MNKLILTAVLASLAGSLTTGGLVWAQHIAKSVRIGQEITKEVRYNTPESTRNDNGDMAKIPADWSLKGVTKGMGENESNLFFQDQQGNVHIVVANQNSSGYFAVYAKVNRIGVMP